MHLLPIFLMTYYHLQHHNFLPTNSRVTFTSAPHIITRPHERKRDRRPLGKGCVYNQVADRFARLLTCGYEQRTPISNNMINMNLLLCFRAPNPSKPAKEERKADALILRQHLLRDLSYSDPFTEGRSDAVETQQPTSKTAV